MNKQSTSSLTATRSRREFLYDELRPVPERLRCRSLRDRYRPRELDAQALSPEGRVHHLEHRREIGRVFATAEAHDLLVIDCRAASTDLFIDFFDEVGFSEVLQSLGAGLTIICPIDHEADSVEQLRILSDAL